VNFLTDDPPLRDRRVTVMGLGCFGGGEGLVRYLAAQGARVTVSDRGPAAPLADVRARLADLPVTFHLDGHRPEHFEAADLVLVNPAVPDDSPFLADRPLETEINLFLKRCPSRRIVGVTGSNGKTTTTWLIGACLRALGLPAWVGGNVGGSLLADLDRIGPEDPVVLELSSFQLERMRPLGRSPRVAVVTNLSPNHLDRHGTMEAYRRAKETIAAFQRPDDWLVCFAPVAGFEGAARRLRFGPGPHVPGVGVEGEALRVALPGAAPLTLDLAGRRLKGRHNLWNMAAAVGAVLALTGIEAAAAAPALRRALAEFAPVEHRLEWVGRWNGIDFYNDSKATTPDATVTSLEALEGPVVLIAGGSDKHVGFDRLADAIRRRVRRLFLIGQTAPKIAAAVRARATHFPQARLGSLQEAIDAAALVARAGDQILLSPACASYDMFHNYVERGRAFKAAVARLPRVGAA
jgi:UDP-N-acetylmuramoylalanine--D-glutamate ligase